MISFNFVFAFITFSMCSLSCSSLIHPRSDHHYRRAVDKTVLLGNGKAAQKLNAKFSTMTTDAACQTGDTACIAGGFYQCVGGKYVGAPCAQGLKCFAMPLLLRNGTSLGCDTEADATTRIADTGATGGLTGENASNSSVASDSTGVNSESQSRENKNSTSVDSPGMTSNSSDASGPNTSKTLTNSENDNLSPDMTVTNSSSPLPSNDTATIDQNGASTESSSTSSDDINSQSRVKVGDQDEKAENAGSLQDDSEKECQGDEADIFDSKATR